MATTIPSYPFDPTGTLASNLITGEQQILTANNFRDYHWIIPNLAPFFADSMQIQFRDTTGAVRTLVEGVDYYLTHWFIAASRACASDIFGSVSFLDTLLTGTVTLQYQTLGGDWVQDSATIATILANNLANPRITSWDVIVNIPYSFPVIDHQWDLADMVGETDLINSLNTIETALRETGQTGLADHLADYGNPHHVTAVQVGLGSVRNLPTSDIPTAQAATSDAVYLTPYSAAAEIQALVGNELHAHETNYSNPHQVTAAQVGAYTTLQTDNLLDGKLNTGAQAADSALFGGKTPLDYMDWVLTGTAANSVEFNGYTFGQAMAQILTGTCANSNALNGYTYQQLVNQLQGGVAQNTVEFNGYTYDQAKADFMSGTAANATNFNGMSYTAAKADILNGTAANATNFAGMSYSAAKADILTGTAANATTFAGYTYAAAKADILTGTAANATNFNGMTYAQVKADILTGTAANATDFNNMTYDQVKADILTGTAANANEVYGMNQSQLLSWLDGTYANTAKTTQQRLYPDYSGPNANSWTPLAQMDNLNTAAANSNLPTDQHWLVSGGESHTDTVSALYYVRVGFRGVNNGSLSVSLSVVNLTQNDPAAINFGYTLDTSTTGLMTLYMQAAGGRMPITVSQLTQVDGADTFVEPSVAPSDVAPTGISYASTIDHFALESQVNAAFSQLSTAFENLKTSVAQ